ncbi:hypothetical protein AAER19_41195, partial [Pseudomonas aeruginosa]
MKKQDKSKQTQQVPNYPIAPAANAELMGSRNPCWRIEAIQVMEKPEQLLKVLSGPISRALPIRLRY